MNFFYLNSVKQKLDVSSVDSFLNIENMFDGYNVLFGSGSKSLQIKSDSDPIRKHL